MCDSVQDSINVTIVGLLIQVEEASKLKNTDIAKELCLPPVKLHCSSMYCCIKMSLLCVCFEKC